MMFYINVKNKSAISKTNPAMVGEYTVTELGYLENVKTVYHSGCPGRMGQAPWLERRVTR